MTNLEENVTPNMNNSENVNPELVQNDTFNPGVLNESTGEKINQPEMFSENLQSHNQSPEQAISQVNEPENPSSTQESTTNNEIILGKFDNPIINTTEETQVSQPIDSSLLEHPAILDNTPSQEQSANEETQNAKIAQKEKLLQLIKVHESKAQKSGFTKGILSGIIITICIFAAGCFLARDEVINLLNNLGGNQSQLSANIANINEDTNENTNENNDDSEINDSTNEDTTKDTDTAEINEDTNEDSNSYEVDEDTNENINEDTDEDAVDNVNNSEAIENIKENTDNSNTNENINEDTVDDIDDGEADESTDEDTDNFDTDETTAENNTFGYSINHVSSEAEANWVMPAHCYDLSCYGEDKEFTPCNTFRLAENLDENANRIGKNGVCKYKNASELVFVEFK